jgi:hypothetical protein
VSALWEEGQVGQQGSGLAGLESGESAILAMDLKSTEQLDMPEGVHNLSATASL